ncbi:MAG: DeoR/GlpR transcriptional regulator [Spirochaetales bacterium]|nr:DeoR/GlpR transcriptional regulator [Spirochaetales bacterium]
MRKRNAVAIEDRQDKILEIIRKEGRASVKELCDTFDMSIVTIRNDLTLLEDEGLVIRTHGGAIAVKEKEEGMILPFDIREERNYAAKQAIGRAAAELVNDGEVIFIDGGTTASEMRHYLADKKDVTIITPSIVVTYWLAVTGNLNIYVLNGFFKRDSYSTTGAPSLDFMSKWNLSKAFFGAAGFTPKAGLSDLDAGFVEQKKIIADKAHMNIGLVDSSKWGILSLGSFADPENIDMLITDDKTSIENIEKARDIGIEVRTVTV